MEALQTAPSSSSAHATTPMPRIRSSSSACTFQPILTVPHPLCSLRILLTSTDNRFNVLASLEPEKILTTKPSRDGHIQKQRRFTRNSRGTKEAKRRRNARRNTRKSSAQRLDEQLSRDIEAIWAEASRAHSSSLSLPAPTPVLPTTTATTPSAFRPILPTPAQLPVLDFHQLSFGDFPALPTQLPFPPTQRSRRLDSPLSQTMLPTIPSWCPDIPSLKRNATSSPNFPLFFDLSMLPEPKRKAANEQLPILPATCQEMLLWRPPSALLAKKSSRFFPKASARPMVKLPVACKLHGSDSGARNVSHSSSQPSADLTQSQTQFLNVLLQDVGAVYEVEQDHDRPDGRDSTAANLWNILAHQKANSPKVPEKPIHTATFASRCDPHFDTFIPEPYVSDIADLRPVELDSKEVPYYHANSLTGHCNEIAISPYADEHALAQNSVIYLSPMPEPLVGLNELAVGYDNNYLSDDDADPENVQLSQTPVEEAECLRDWCSDWRNYANEVAAAHTFTTPVMPTSASMIDTDNQAAGLLMHSAEHDEDDPSTKKSDAHFQSEQELFATSAPPTESLEHSLLDITDFIKLGHAPNCWCGFCDDEPELVPSEQLSEEDGWMVYSATDFASMTSGSPNSSVDNGQEVTRTKCTGTAPEWDDFFPCRPSSAWEASLGVHGDEGFGLGFGYDVIDDYKW